MDRLTLINRVESAIGQLCREYALTDNERKYNEYYQLRMDIKQYEENYNEMLSFIKALSFERYSDEDIEDFNRHGVYLESKEARDFLRRIGEI